MNLRVERYRLELSQHWRVVLHGARNGIFQFERGYIEYHGDRFEDMSAIAYVDDQPVAVMPAAFDSSTRKVTSHPGLTFGGPVFMRDLRSGIGLEIIDALLHAFREWGGTSCLVKVLPSVFAAYPSAEVDYGLWRHGFSLVRRDLSSLLPLETALPFNSSKSQSEKKAKRSGICVGETSMASFHELLSCVLLAQHGARPVHSIEELGLLHGRFPANLFVRGAWLEGRLLAGTLVFNYGHIWHTQYLASSNEGRNLGALDLVIAELIREAAAAGTSFLSFGTSTVEQGTEINDGLLWQKESYGARGLVHDYLEGTL